MAGKRLIVTIVIILGLTSGCGNAVGTPVVTPSPPAETTVVPKPSPPPRPSLVFDILGVNSYEDPVGSLRFLLEVRNMNDFDVENVKATVFLHDTDGQTIQSETGYARLDVLRTGGRLHIMVVFFLASPEFSTYEVQIEGQEADYLAELLHQDLQIVEQTGRVGQWVPYEVLGQVHNAGGRDAESVNLVVACYDDDGKVVAVGTGRPAERVIPVGDSADFLVSIGAVAGEIANCNVQAEGLIANYADWF